MFIFSFSISFISLVVILLILCVIPLSDSAPAHSPSGKELNPSSQENAHFSGCCTLAYNFHFILCHPSLGLSNSSLTHPLVKSSTLPLRKIPIFQGVAPWHTISTSSCVIPLWDSATAHIPSGKELILSSLEESCFSGLIVLLMFSHYPSWAVFGLVLTHITN